AGSPGLLRRSARPGAATRTGGQPRAGRGRKRRGAPRGRPRTPRESTRPRSRRGARRRRGGKRAWWFGSSWRSHRANVALAVDVEELVGGDRGEIHAEEDGEAGLRLVDGRRAARRPRAARAAGLDLPQALVALHVVDAAGEMVA